MKKAMSSLDLIEIASPCAASWDEMMGDERVRFCRHCKLHVYNLSEMPHEEAESFMRKRTGRTCVRFYRRADGTLLTRDCPVGLRALRQRFVRAVAALAGILIALVSGTLLGSAVSRRSAGLVAPSQAFSDWIHPERRWSILMGKVASPAAAMGGCPAPMGIVALPASEPAETPLLPPTAEQLEQIQQRLRD
jgi:hypothetical protein